MNLPSYYGEEPPRPSDLEPYQDEAPLHPADVDDDGFRCDECGSRRCRGCAEDWS